MEKPVLIYCYDAYCGWCYGFSPVIRKVAEFFSDRMDIDVLSGGMILPGKPIHIRVSAKFISEAYKNVEAATGIEFGKDYLWHVLNPEESDWYPNSEKPAIAMCIFKEFYPERAIEFAADLQFALHYEGRDLTDDQAYIGLLEKYSIQEEIFFSKLNSEEYKQQAYYEFALVKQLQVNAFPVVLVQMSETKFHMVARGFTEFDILKERIEKVLET